MSFDFSSVKDKKRKVTTSETQEKKTETKKEEKKSSSGFDFYSVQNKTLSSSSSAYDSERLEYLNTKEARDKKSALEQELAEAKAQAKAETEKAGTVQIVASGRKGANVSLVHPETQKKIDELEKEISNLNKNINLASRIQNNKYLTDRAVSAEDFGEYSFDPIIPEKRNTITPHAQNIEREDSSAKYMSEDQKAIYNYYYNKMGEDKAEEYLDSIRENINEKQSEAIFKGNEDNEAAQLLMALATNMERAKEGYQGSARMLLGDDSYTPKSSAEYLNEMAAEGLYDELVLPKWFEENLGIHSLGQLAYDAVANTGNMLPSMALGLVPIPGMSGLAIGASAAGNAYTEKINEGYSREQATTYATIIGASEAALSNVLSTATGGKFLKGKLDEAIENVDKVAARIALKYGAGFLSEGVEEGLQEYLEPLYRNIAFNETNELKITPEVIYAGIVGGLSGGFYAGADAVTSEIGANYKAKQTYGEVQNELIEEGLAAPEGSKAHKLAQQAKEKLDKGKDLSGNELRRIAEANDKAFSEEENVEASKTETSGEEDLKNLAKEVVEEKAEEPTASVKNKAGRYVQTISKEGLEEYGRKLPNATKDTGKQVAAMYDPADGISKEAFAKAIDEAYKYGTFSYPIKEMDSDSVFAKAIPSEKRHQAYYMGQQNAKAANIENAKIMQKKVLPGVKGKVVIENGVNLEKLSEHQKTVIELTDMLSKVNEIEHHVKASYELKKDYFYKNKKGETIKIEAGTRVWEMDGEIVPAENGWTDPKTHQVWYDINAGDQGQGIPEQTVSHEYLHDMRVEAPGKYNELVGIVSEVFERNGKSFSEAVAVKLKQYNDHDINIDEDGAQEEIVAQAVSGMFNDPKTLEEFSKVLYKKDKTLWNEIKDWIAEIIERIKEALKGVEIESEEARMLKAEKDLYERAQKIYVEGIVEAGEKYKAYSKTFKDLVKSTEGDTDVYKDKNGAVVAVAEKGNENNIKYNIGEYRGSGKKILENWLDEHADKKTKDQILVSMDAAVDIVDALEKQIPVFKEWGEVGITFDDSGKPVLRCKVKNGEYEINFDFSTVCKKRKGLDAVLNNLIKSGKINLLDLSKSDIQFINETLDKHGFEIACGLCFVDSKRYRVGEWAHNAATMFNDIVNSLVKPEDLDKIGSFNFAKNEAMTVIEGDISTWDDSLLDFSTINNILTTESNAEGMGYKKAFARLIKANPKYRKFLTSSDIISSGGSNVMRNEASDLLAAVNAVGGTSKPKMSFSESIWDHSILLDNRITKEAAYAMGGARTQSFSDFVATMFFDYCQMFAEAQAKGLPMQAYTKELTFAKLFGLTGLRLNLSVLHGVDISAEDRAWLDSKYKKNPKTGELELKISGEKDKERLERIKENAGLDAYGNYIYEKQSIDFDESVKLQNTEGYSRYIGTIVVGISEKHIRKLLDDNRARMIIPYHKSGLSAVIAKARNIDCYTDFTKHQNTRLGKSWGEDAGKGINSAKLSSDTKSKLKEIAWDFYSVLHAYEKDWDTETNSWKKGTGHANTITYEMDSNGISTFKNDPMRQTCEDYLVWCEEHDMIPQFEQFIKHPNYYKMQEDFDVYDCITGEYVPQGSVEFRLPENAGEVLLEELKLQQETSDRLNKEMSGIVDEIINERGRQIPPEINLGIKHSLRGTEFQDRDSDVDIDAQVNMTRAWIDNIENRLSDPFFAEENPKVANELRAKLESLYRDLRGELAEVRKQTKKTSLKTILENLEYYSDLDIEGLANDISENNWDFKEEGLSRAEIIEGIREMLEEKMEDMSPLEQQSPKFGFYVRPVNKNDDIRYSDRDSDGRELSKEQAEFFKDSKVRDEKGNLLTMYHGTNNDFWTFDTNIAGGKNGIAEGYGIYLTDKKDVANNYGSRKIEAYVNIVKPATSFKKTITASTLAKLIKDTCVREAQEFVANDDYDNVKDALFDTWISNYVMTYDLGMERAYQEAAKSIFRFDNNDMDIIREVMSGMGIRSYADAMNFYHTSLTPITGFDGFATEWDNNGEKSRIYLAFDSNQIKSVDNKTPTTDPDIRFQDRLSNADKNRVEVLENKNARLEKELADLEKAYESVQNYARAEGILIGQVEQGRTMAKEMRQKQATFDRKAKGYENAIAKKKEQISAVRQQKNELLAKAKAERAEAVERVRKADRERMEKAIADIKATERAKFNAAKERSDEQKRAIIEKYQTSIKKATEGRHKTDIRGKIKRVVNELNTLLTKQTKERHIPLELQKPVADALDILNLDDQRYYESRIRGFEARIAEAKSSEERHLLQEELNKIIDQRTAFKDKIAGLKKAYEAIRTSTDPYIAVGYNENIAKMIDRVAEDIGDTLLRDMSMTQLQEVYDLYKGILKTVRDANKFFAEEKGASVVEAGRNVVSEIEASGKTIDQISRKKLERKKFFWNNLKPVYAFKKLGSKTLENLFGGILKGQGTWAKDVSEAKDFFERIGNKYGYKKWDKKKTFEFTSNTGKKFSLNLQQMMSLYAYSKRDQAFKHLTDGGFVFDNKETIKKNGKEYVVNTAQAYNISAATLQQIVGKLSTDQRMFVDEMQKYLSETMGAKGNEVSRAMYDIELFREAEGYFPLKSAKQFLYDRNEVTNETRQLVNSGFTKPIQPGANNPIILTGFMDVWANHVNDMSMYHAFVMPIENFNKVYNFQFGRSEESDSKSVKSAIQDSFTEAANQYIEQLLKDINGGARTDSRESNYKRLVGNWKKAAVFASASVVIQQPSAIGRAFAEINPVYFMAPTEIGVLKHKKQWEQVKKYAPVAVIKEMGYFDTDMGRSTAEFIKGEKTLKDRADDVFGFAPAKADEYTWCAIWDAVKRETKAKHKDLNVNSEEFLKIAGERFTEVIDKTQVYDSVLSRSGNMRSKSIFMQMLTAFMAEPTTSANMVEQAFREAKAGHKKKAMAYINSVGASVIINSLLVSFVYALRDDDEDERFHDKYLESLLKELADGFNPLTYIPLAKDVWSIFQGWDVERVDMSLFKDLYDNLEKEVKTVKELVEGIIDGSLSEEEIKAGFKEAGEYMFPVLDTIASMNGIPLKNLRRDFYTMPKNTFKIFNQNQKELSYSEKYLWDILHEAFLDQAPFGNVFMETRDNKLLDGMVSGDKVYLERLKKSYSSEDAYNNAVKAVIKNGYASKKLSLEKAKQLLVKYHGEDITEAEALLRTLDFKKGDADTSLSDSQIKNYYLPIAIKNSDQLLKSPYEYGISEKTYSEYIMLKAECKGVDKNNDGKADSGSVKKEVMKVIDNLNLTKEQKDALYYDNGWAKGTLHEAPWR